MPPRFRVGPAVVNIGAMAPDMTETVVGFAEAALRDCMNENQMATSIRLALSGKWSDKTWQVRAGTRGCGAARRGARGCRRRRREQTQRGCPSRIARALPHTPQVLVGRNFGSFVTFEDKHYVYFYIGQMCAAALRAASTDRRTRLTPPSPCPSLCRGFVIFA